MSKKLREIIFDIDGVLRDLSGYIANKLNCKIPTYWDEGYCGKDIFTVVKELNYTPLTKAEPLDYVFVLNTFYLIKPPVSIWTSQPKEWLPYTAEWLRKYITKPIKIVNFDNMLDKEVALYKLTTDSLLIDDCPIFSNYQRIIVIDAPYNKSIIPIPPYRAKSADELMHLLIKICRY